MLNVPSVPFVGIGGSKVVAKTPAKGAVPPRAALPATTGNKFVAETGTMPAWSSYSGPTVAVTSGGPVLSRPDQIKADYAAESAAAKKYEMAGIQMPKSTAEQKFSDILKNGTPGYEQYDYGSKTAMDTTKHEAGLTSLLQNGNPGYEQQMTPKTPTGPQPRPMSEKDLTNLLKNGTPEYEHHDYGSPAAMAAEYNGYPGLTGPAASGNGGANGVQASAYAGQGNRLQQDRAAGRLPEPGGPMGLGGSVVGASPNVAPTGPVNPNQPAPPPATAYGSSNAMAAYPGYKPQGA